MSGREIAWALIGLMMGIRAAVRARSAVQRVRETGDVFGEAHLTESTIVVPLMSTVGLVVCWGLSQTYTGNVTVLAHVIFVATCIVLALVDIDTHVLPRRTTYGALLVGLPLLAIADVVDGEGSVVRAVLGALILWMVLNVLSVLSRGDLGGGDVTLGLLLGAYMGFRSVWDVAIGLGVGFAVGGVFALGLLISGKANRRTRFAFGPFLIVGAVVVVLR